MSSTPGLRFSQSIGALYAAGVDTQSPHQMRYPVEYALLRIALIMKPRSPTISCWVLEDHRGVVTADQGEGEALIIFRDLEEARSFQARTATEACRLVSMSREALQALLLKYDLRWVAVLKPRTEAHVVDLVSTQAFIDMLAEDFEK
jgi:hypothetical protein